MPPRTAAAVLLMVLGAGCGAAATQPRPTPQLTASPHPPAAAADQAAPSATPPPSAEPRPIPTAPPGDGTAPKATAAPTPGAGPTATSLPSAAPRPLPLPAEAPVPCLEGIARPHGLGIDLQGRLLVSSVSEQAVFRVALPGGQPERLAGGLDFAHDMRTAADGTIYAPLVNAGQLVAIRPDGRVEVIASDLPGANGLALTPEGGWIVSNYFAHTVVEIRPDGGRRTLLEGLAGPAGLVLEEDGSLHVANFQDPSRAVLTRRPGGEVEVLLAGPVHAESLARGPDGLLYVGHASASVGQVSRLGPASRLEPFLLTRVPEPIVGPVFGTDGTLVLHSASGLDDTIYCLPP